MLADTSTHMATKHSRLSSLSPGLNFSRSVHVVSRPICLLCASCQVKDNGIVLFCYPKANTKGCTSQAVGLSEKVEELAAAGYKVSEAPALH